MKCASRLDCVWKERREPVGGPELRGRLSWHARFYPRYSERFEADGLLGTRLIPNFTSIVGLPGTEPAFVNDHYNTFWFMTDEQGFPPDVIELQLAHSERNKVRAAYNKAQRLPERRKMMQAWADYLDALRERARIARDLRPVWP